MNQRTAKEIRRYTRAIGDLGYRARKRFWNRLPSTGRAKLRLEMFRLTTVNTVRYA